MATVTAILFKSLYCDFFGVGWERCLCSGVKKRDGSGPGDGLGGGAGGGGGGGGGVRQHNKNQEMKGGGGACARLVSSMQNTKPENPAEGPITSQRPI